MRRQRTYRAFGVVTRFATTIHVTAALEDENDMDTVMNVLEVCGRRVHHPPATTAGASLLLLSGAGQVAYVAGSNQPVRPPPSADFVCQRWAAPASASMCGGGGGGGGGVL
jgi:hypothetical protein